MPRFRFIATYITANRKNGTIYTGSTSDLIERMGQHKSGTGSVFTGTYNCDRLVWFERHADMASAIHREKRIKTWSRAWKTDLIETLNPHWDDLTAGLSEYDG